MASEKGHMLGRLDYEADLCRALRRNFIFLMVFFKYIQENTIKKQQSKSYITAAPLKNSIRKPSRKISFDFEILLIIIGNTTCTGPMLT